MDGNYIAFSMLLNKEKVYNTGETKGTQQLKLYNSVLSTPHLPL